MRQVKSFGSVRAVSLSRDELLSRLRQIAQEALVTFPEIHEIRLFGSLARGEETGLSDIDLFNVTEQEEENPVERLRPYFVFFTNRLPMAIDILTVRPQEVKNFVDILQESILLGKGRRRQISFVGLCSVY